jgi:hypothetical protein
VGNRVVRYGRALDEKSTEQFVRDFERAMSAYHEKHPPRLPPVEVEEKPAEPREEASTT